MPPTSAAPALVVGLGNPGERYTETRHNAGFWFVDELARRYGGSFRAERKFHGDLAEVEIHGRRCLLLKPMTFMNRSGQAVAAAGRFYKLAADAILVAHDEIDLPPGQVKLKQGGGHGGHNGLRDLIKMGGSADFWRLRLGVGHPGHKDLVVSYVLDRPRLEEQELIDQTVVLAVDVFPLILEGDWAKAQQQLHSFKP